MENTTPLYKAYEMEEFLDLKFYHPLGFRFAKAAFRLGLTPDQVSLASMALGVAGGLMLSSMRTAYWGFALLVFSSVLDSSDGQLARMRGGGTLRGRILDGMIGYMMFTASYIGLCALYAGLHGGSGWAFIAMLALAGGLLSAVQSSMYDYYRTNFASIVSKSRINDESREQLGFFFKAAYAGYNFYQRIFAGSHRKLLALAARKYPGGAVSAEFRGAYLSGNRRMIRAWNLLGDNTRFLAILACLILYRPQWYFFFIIGPMSVLLLAFTALQRRADQELIRGLERG